MKDEMIVAGQDITPTYSQGDLLVLDQIDKTIESCTVNADPEPAMKLAHTLSKNGRLMSLALAKTVTRLENHWSEFKAGGIDEEFVDYVSGGLGITVQTVKKYTGMYTAIFDNPDVPVEVKQHLLGTPIQSLLLLTAAAREGVVEWKRVLEATTPADIAELVKEWRGQQTSSKERLYLSLNVRNGNLEVKRGEEPWKPIGWLDVNDKDELVQKAIDRIKHGAGLMEV